MADRGHTGKIVRRLQILPVIEFQTILSACLNRTVGITATHAKLIPLSVIGPIAIGGINPISRQGKATMHCAVQKAGSHACKEERRFGCWDR